MNIAKQRGVSLLGWILILIVVGFVASIAFKIIPHYMDNNTLDKLILATERDMATGKRINNVGDLYSHLDKGMQINNMHGLAARKVMEIRSDGPYYLVHVNYERRETILKNIDLVLTFEKEYRVHNQ